MKEIIVRVAKLMDDDGSPGSVRYPRNQLPHLKFIVAVGSHTVTMTTLGLMTSVIARVCMLRIRAADRSKAL